MIHAAITAVALSCCTTITLADNTTHADEGTSIDFKGGTVAQYIQEVTDGFKADNQDPNIILLPGTEGVVLPAMSLRIMQPGDAFAAISDYVYTVADGKQVSVDFEMVGGESTIYRISGHDWMPSSRARTAPRGSVPAVEDKDDVSVSIIRVPASKLESVVRLSSKVLDLAGISSRTSLVPLPEDNLLLVSSTMTGQTLMQEVVFEVLRPKKNSTDAEPRSHRRSPAETDHRKALKSELAELARKKNDPSMDPAERKDIDQRFTKALNGLRGKN